MMDGTIYIFAAYKFDSKYYKKEDLERAIKEAVKNIQTTLRKKFKGLTLQLIEQRQILPGEYVGEFVKNSLDKAMITIFDLSDREPNVTFELGYSLGMAKYRFALQDGYDILIQCDKVDPRDTISDLLGKFIVLYEYDSNSRQKDEYKKIQRKIETELKRKVCNLLEDGRFLKRLVWRMYQEKVYVICPYIPPADQDIWDPQEDFEDYILDKINNKKYYTSKRKKNGEDIITADYGIFGVLPNKYAKGKVIVLISGITSAGGLGAARAFTEGEASHQNCRSVVKTVGLKNYFITLVESDIRWDEFTYPKRVKKSMIFLYLYDQKENLWRRPHEK